jgi:hypothetical protein
VPIHRDTVCELDAFDSLAQRREFVGLLQCAGKDAKGFYAGGKEKKLELFL